MCDVTDETIGSQGAPCDEGIFGVQITRKAEALKHGGWVPRKEGFGFWEDWLGGEGPAQEAARAVRDLGSSLC